MLKLANFNLNLILLLSSLFVLSQAFPPGAVRLTTTKPLGRMLSSMAPAAARGSHHKTPKKPTKLPNVSSRSLNTYHGAAQSSRTTTAHTTSVPTESPQQMVSTAVYRRGRLNVTDMSYEDYIAQALSTHSPSTIETSEKWEVEEESNDTLTIVLSSNLDQIESATKQFKTTSPLPKTETDLSISTSAKIEVHQYLTTDTPTTLPTTAWTTAEVEPLTTRYVLSVLLQAPAKSESEDKVDYKTAQVPEETPEVPMLSSLASTLPATKSLNEDPTASVYNEGSISASMEPTGYIVYSGHTSIALPHGKCDYLEELLKKIEQEHNQLFDSSYNKDPEERVASSRRIEKESDEQNKEDMSSIVPTTCGSLRDRNNNTTARDDNDEVQAVLITGCGSKIGRNIAVTFARMGLNVALVDFDTQQTDSVANECQEISPKNRVPLQIVADISQLDESHKVIDRTIKEFGRLDVLVNTVNNASLMEAKFNGSGDDDPHVFEQYHKIIANNMHSVTYLCISAAPHLRKTKGSIINVSSLTNNETGSYKFAYCMSKAGISTLTKCLATDLAPDIKVVCITPKNDQ